jgi:UDP-N-acetylmuramyl pentapeptide synthase
MKEDMSSKIAKFEMPLLVFSQWIPNSSFVNKIPEKKIKIEGLSIDSRAVHKNFLFFSIKGENHDGHSFLEQAKKK